jgi:pimeloyl-ACP methyl ester carboxylesterase
MRGAQTGPTGSSCRDDRMDLLSEFSHPTRWYSKLIAASLALAFFTLLAGAIISGFVIYRIVAPTVINESIDIRTFPGHPENVSYDAGGTTREGWFFPGLKSAPTILLCSGYQASRGELLPLATALQDHQYNVFLFDFGSQGSSSTRSTLGFTEVRDLRAAVTELAGRDDVDRTRFGLWGTNLGAYVAVAVAETDPRVRAIVAESVFDRPQDMVRVLVGRYGLAPLPLLPDMVDKGFLWVNYPYRETPPLSANLSRLAGVPKLFLSASDQADLMASTHRLFVLAPEPKDEALLARGNYAGMLDEEKRDYENRIVGFFLLSLPVKAAFQQ